MKTRLVTTLILLSLAITACSSASALAQSAATLAGSTYLSGTQLALGTLDLEGTQEAVTIEQARELLTYWQAYQSLSQADITAQAELDGLVEQIQETMTSEQIAAISAMDLAGQDVSSLLQTQAAGQPQASSAAAPAGAGAAPVDGMAGGAPPDDMLGGMQVQAGTSGSSQAGSTGIPAALVTALIQAMQEKISS